LTAGTREALMWVGAALVVALVAGGCASGRVGRGDASSCRTLDSLYASCGFERPVSIDGKVTVDAEQYRVRGKIGLDVRAPGEIVLEFTSTVLFGHAREDIVFASLADTLRIIDRERGAYYEGYEAESFLEESLETDFDVRRVLRLALGGRPSCETLSDVRVDLKPGGKIVCTGRHLGEGFRVAFGARGRLEAVEWPVRSETRGADKLRASYQWQLDGPGEGTLREIVVSLEKREWRCKIRGGG
jgi:hypothetical protein